ncbi:MAG: type IV pilus biogenesis protein PilI-like protein [uncultured bacterium (gcode 4)]|uniref:Type IV pilus biogenesis protein PilI-like protein n=1 Tax=uncultured bacterium (gcode 4) TaxID=1234023 RepID=K2FEP8_9BACT|nr:MAG: type IV pilus biogenesis protein PilI-like protein [uncultured bacterium (gcode 4)]
MLNIAINTFRELARNKILYLILFFWVLLIIFSLALASLSMWQTDKIIIDFWLAMIEMFWLVSVIFIGSQLIFKEIEWKTIYLILSKPISRYQFILGKFIWFAMILACIIFFQSVIFWALLVYSKTAFVYLIPVSIVFIYLKLLVLFAIILFFSTFISSILSIVLTMLVYVISHSLTSIIDMAVHAKSMALLNIGKVLYIVFPNFEWLNIKNLILSPVIIDFKYISLNSLYAVTYLVLILGFTIIIFNRKTFEN